MNNNEPHTPEWSPATLREMVWSFQKSRAFLTAYELGLFTVIGNSEHSSDYIATVIGADARATDRLLNAIVGMKLLDKHDGKFTNTSFSQKYLVKTAPDYLGGLAHAENLWRNWSTLTAAVVAGTSVVERRYTHAGFDPLRGFIAAMHDRARNNAPQIAAMIDWTGVKRVLDLGGGSGIYAMAFARAKEDMCITVFDLPSVTPLTREYIEQEKLANRISTLDGDYLHDTVGSGYDLIFLSAIIHSNAADENHRLIAKCAAALNPGGRIIIQDYVMDDNRITPAHGALFALNMLVATSFGDTFTETEIKGWLQAAGINEIDRKETGTGTTQVIGKKA